MARDRQKDARERVAGSLEGRPKALRRELVDLEEELERARRRRDRAQARLEALEAIAEQLTVALAAAEAARDARRPRQDDSSEPEPAQPDLPAVVANDRSEGAAGPAPRRGKRAVDPTTGAAGGKDPVRRTAPATSSRTAANGRASSDTATPTRGTSRRTREPAPEG
jgi:hypothetical protein